MLSTLLSLAAVPVLAQALDITQQDGLLRFPLRVSKGAPVVKNITKRQNEINLENQQTGFFYSIDIELGTPGQVVTLNFDTGSTELWVNPVCANADQPEYCASFPRFTESSTVEDLGSSNRVTYGTGYAEFEYVQDYVTIGSAKITQQIFGVAYDTAFWSVGILGAGPDINGWDAPYKLVIDNLVDQGFIESRALSLDIRSQDSTEGAVIYGGIDTKKYSGPLEKLPIVPASESPDGLTRYWVNLNGLSVKQDDGSRDEIFDGTQAFLLDSGYTLSGFPTPIFEALLAAFPSATQIPGSTSYEIDCEVGDLDGTVDFLFGETTIKVAYSDFIWPQPQNNRCIFGAFEDNDLPVLGDTFLRAAYVVYDWDNRNVHLAPSDDCGSNLVAIGSGPDAVPSLVGECGGSQTSTTSEAPTSTETSATETSATETETETTAEPTTETTAEPTTETTAESETTTEGSTQTTEAESSTVTTKATHEPTTFLSTIESSTRYYNTSSGYGHTTHAPTYTATLTKTNVHTITSCPPEVTKCPIGSVTTEIITSYTTWCPGSKTTKPPKVTSTFTKTRVHTVTSCPGRAKCTESLTTEVVTTTALVCPQTTGTYTLPKTVTCGKSTSGCPEGQTKTYTNVVTVKPHTEHSVPTAVPSCSTCAPPPHGNNATATWYPTGKAPTTQAPTYAAPTSEATEPAVVTGGGSWNAPGFVAVVMGFILAAAL